MDNITKKVFNYIIQKQDGFWKQTVRLVIDWLILQDFEIKYIGDFHEI